MNQDRMNNKQRQQQPMYQSQKQQLHNNNNLAQQNYQLQEFADDAVARHQVQPIMRPIGRLPASGGGGVSAKGKDLIIRMLAEVFQVDQADNGNQVKWQQVSSSLVPVSLYSRTTSRWLNYLLASSSATQYQQQQPNNASSSAMSPDSCDFLLMLQQFHQSTRKRGANSASLMTNDEPPGTVLFQVVAHDYYDGQCKKILNVKIAQPGTRLGQASDYFVYWKEPPQTRLQQQQQVPFYNQSSSIASNQTPARTHLNVTAQSMNAAQLSQSPSFGNQDINCCFNNKPNSHNWPQQRTWGLNFASVNDAKLFYDICSLNLVDLNFNSGYLEQLAAGDMRPRASMHQTAAVPTATPTSGREKQEQKLIRDFLNYKQRRLMEQSSSNSVVSHQARQHFCADQDDRLASCGMPKCQSCNRFVQQQHQLVSNKRLDTLVAECPVHSALVGVNHSVDSRSRQASMQGGSMRTRSRSTGRRREPMTITTAALAGGLHGDESSSKRRIRSFSTPASPERDPNCPVHQQRDGERAAAEPETLNHHPRCLNSYYLQQQQQQQSTLARPKKPARGLLRDPSNEVRQPQQVASTDQDEDEQRGPARSCRGATRAPNQRHRSAGFEHQLQHQQQPMTRHNDRFVSSSGDDDGAAAAALAAHRNASLARAQYANSKNLKEFLSLDAGGQQQTTPTQLAALNQRFQQQLRGCQAASSSSVNVNATASSQPASYHEQQASGRELNEPRQARPLAATAAASDSSEATPLRPQAAAAAGEAKKSSRQQQRAGEAAAAATSGELQRMKRELRNNASTTTEDLPLDPLTRSRMFKLTSEEVISERTEPASISTPSAALAGGAGAAAAGQQQAEQLLKRRQRQQQQHQAACLEDADSIEGRIRQMRAVSLGPGMDLSGGELGDKWPRGRSVRSDSGRRRSLERSMCVDLTADAAASDYPAAPSAAVVCNEGGRDQNNNYPQSANLASQLQQQQQQPPPRQYQQTKRARTKSSNEADLMATPTLTCSQTNYCACQLISTPNSGERGPPNSRRPNHRPPSSLLFKSAPDVSMLVEQAPAASGQYYRSNLEHTHQHRQWPGGGCSPDDETVAPRVASFYAAPLCGDPTARRAPPQSFATVATNTTHSCPNSLRRSRRLHQNQPQYHHHQPQPHQGLQELGPICQLGVETAGAVHSARGTAAGWREARSGECHCQMCRVASHASCAQQQAASRYNSQVASSPGKSADSCQSCGLVGGSGSGFSSQRQHFNAQMNHVSPVDAMTRHKHSNSAVTPRQSTAATDCYGLQHQARPHSSCRPCSSLSSRSPVHYGLYESDCDDENNGDRIEGDDGDVENNEQVDPGATMRAVEYPCECGLAKQGVSFRPVAGYDQTMARASLKSRQRAKSQPPPAAAAVSSSSLGSQDNQAATAAATEQAAHLNKSMENVQKLIKEVQNELRALSGRKPVAGATPAQCLRQASQIQQSQPDTVADKTTATELKMRQEEQRMAASGGQLHHHHHQQHTLAGGSSTSATRRAGQFRCVGAIRKAGFLSVKKWILKRRQSIELARKQGWKRYWVCLRGTALLFHSVIDKKEALDDEQQANGNAVDFITWIKANCCAESQTQLALAANLLDQQAAMSHEQRELFGWMSQCYIEREPRHLIIVDGAIGQPIPEHPKRDFVFCLSTIFGDAYLFQASCQSESDSWIAALHNACAASIARDLTRDEATKLFEAKIRHLEMEAEKKLFLRIRLESRLNSMSSMSHISALVASAYPPPTVNGDNKMASNELEDKRATMRSLLFKLHQQLLALDNYLEQVHCEIYQLRCYLSSCLAHQLYRYASNDNNSGSNQQATSNNIDLPHPKGLLMHVSKPTKLLLIKLGVFTVSSFHALIHARQGSSNTILQRMQEQRDKLIVGRPPVKCLEATSATDQQSTCARPRAHSISERLLGSKEQTKELEADTEQLIQLANLRSVRIRLERRLFDALRGDQAASLSPLQSDDRCSFHDEDDGRLMLINLKLHSSSSALSIIEQVLSILRPQSESARCQSQALNYYLRFSPNETNDADAERAVASRAGGQAIYVAKRGERLADWSNFDHLELAEKIVFKVQLTRRRLDEEAVPFGISVGAQLIELGATDIDGAQQVGARGTADQQLDVYCSYIEWGSAADRAGLKDEDELLIINGIPVMDLDMMFIESMIRDESSLHLVVRSCRDEPPASAIALDRSTWLPYDDNTGGGGDGVKDDEGFIDSAANIGTGNMAPAAEGSQLISDEYISSLVCPPPPTRSKAFLRTDTCLLRQKSDFCKVPAPNNSGENALSKDSVDGEAKQTRMVTSATVPSLSSESSLQPKAKSQVELRDESNIDEHARVEQLAEINDKDERGENGKQLTDVVCAKSQTNRSLVQDPNLVERLRKSVLELLETEYAYIRHLETIGEHYMSPMAECNHLNIADLEHLNQTIQQLSSFQREFFHKLLTSILANYSDYTSIDGPVLSSPQKVVSVSDESEELNTIVRQLEAFATIDQFKVTLRTVARLFIQEADKFRAYSAYCVAYSRLQKFLHPKRSHHGSGAHSIIAPAQQPMPLDTFVASPPIQPLSLTTNSSSQRDFFRPLGSFKPYGNGTTNQHNNNGNSNSNKNVSATNGSSNSSFSSANDPSDQDQQQVDAQLKQLSEFLANLDSSSSSASTSLPTKSSSGTSSLDNQSSYSSDNHKRPSAAKSQTSASGTSTNHHFQKSVNQQNFESYLIKPIQRIVRYPMLLNSIVQVYNFEGNDDDTIGDELQSAMRQMSSITSHVNDAQRIQDEYGATFETIERQFHAQASSNPSTHSHDAKMNYLAARQPAINLSIENLLHFGPVDWLNLQEFASTCPATNGPSKQRKGSVPSGNLSQILFVFNSCVVFICKERVVPTRGPLTSLNGGNKSQSAKQRKFMIPTSLTSSTAATHTTAGTLGGAFQQSNGHAQSTLFSTNNASKSSQIKMLTSEPSQEIIRYQSIIPVCEVQVRPVTLTAKKQQATDSYQWELFRCSSVNSNSSLLTKTNKRQTNGKVYLLASPSNETRNAFLRKIRLIIRESVRNMSLPLARSPSSKSLTPKKLSSPTTTSDSNTNSSCSH